MSEVKKVTFKWEFGEELVSLQVNSYVYGNGLYIGMTHYEEDGAEPFADLTVNLRGYSLDVNEAFIDGDISRDLLNFIKEYQLGKVLPFTGRSGMSTYAAVAFNLEKLAEFDPEGMKAYKTLRGIA